MANWSTIHIFGYGETQIIGKDLNKKVATSSLTKVQDVIDMVYATKPQDNPCTKDYHAINIFEGMFSDFQPKTQGEKGFRTQWANLTQATIDALVAEMEALPTEAPTTPNP
jgi:hypothetical protein